MQPITIQRPAKKILTLGPILLLLVFAAFVVLAAIFWPFNRASVLKDLAEASLTTVDAGSFRRIYFPHPGCVLQHVTFRHNPKAGTPPLISVDTLRIEGSFTGLFTSHVHLIRADGLHLLIPPRGSEKPFQPPQRSTFVIDDLIADGAILDVASGDPGEQPLKFSFHTFSLSGIGGDGPAVFHARISNPEPPGEITTTGKFGPWSEGDVGATQVSGNYVFERADLGVFPGISGLLSSSGNFSGILKHIEVEGDTDVPHFAVKISSHQAPLRTRFHAVVNAENGDTFLQHVNASFWKTNVSSQGSVAKQSGQPGKTVSLQIASRNGRIQDILLLFARSPRAPMSGLISFQAVVSIPSQSRPFLEKVWLDGDFGINAGGFTKGDTQESVNRLSKGALGEQSPPKNELAQDDSENVLSDLKGHVILKNGTARFSGLSFSVPGALAQLQGTYSLVTEKIDLRGTLKTNSEVSKTTTGMKAVMLKVLEPLFKKKRVGYVVPIKITGTYDHPFFGLDLVDRGNNKTDKKTDNKQTTIKKTTGVR